LETVLNGDEDERTFYIMVFWKIQSIHFLCGCFESRSGSIIRATSQLEKRADESINAEDTEMLRTSA
jgi:hypothetical protein